MPNSRRKFQDFVLKSRVFKGRPDWYFCYAKSERIAHVLWMLAHRAGSTSDGFVELVRAAAQLPDTIVHFAAGEVGEELVLADIFSLLSALRLAAARGDVVAENASVLIDEYERIAEKLGGTGSHPSPLISEEDLAVPPIPLDPFEPFSTVLGGAAPGMNVLHIKDKSKGHLSPTKPHSKGHAQVQGMQERRATILDFVRKNKAVSIKEISAVVKGCSTKTVQRELTSLIEQGLIRKEGERRWSVYSPTRLEK